MSRLDKAREVVAEVRDALDEAGLDKVLADVNAAVVPSGSRHGVVIVSPPEMTFETFGGDPGLTWDLHVIAGPPGDYLEAWRKIDAIIAALEASRLPLNTAKPGAWSGLDPSSPPIPAYTVTLHPID